MQTIPQRAKSISDWIIRYRLRALTHSGEPSLLPVGELLSELDSDRIIGVYSIIHVNHSILLESVPYPLISIGGVGMTDATKQLRNKFTIICGAVFFSLYPLMLIVAYLVGRQINSFQLYGAAMSLFVAFVLWGCLYQFRFDNSDRRIALVYWCALIVGGIAFLGGFIGPIIFTPEANQGPLFGIFFTGPIGAVFGGILGLAYLAVSSESEKKSDN